MIMGMSGLTARIDDNDEKGKVADRATAAAKSLKDTSADPGAFSGVDADDPRTPA